MVRITEISKKTARTAWTWAEENQDTDPLAEAYIGACSAVGLLDREAVAKRLGISNDAMASIDAHAFEYRNALARGIVKILRKMP